MGLWSKIKGWLNIGGVKMQLECGDPTIYVGGNTITCKVILTAKSDKEVLSVKCRVVNQKTEKKDGQERTKTTTLGEQLYSGTTTVKAGETEEIDVEVEYHLDESMSRMGGVAGAVGKLGKFAMGKKDSFSLIAECDVKGTVMDPSDSVVLKIGQKEKA